MSRSLFANLHRRYGERLSSSDRRKQINARLDAFIDESPKRVGLQSRVETVFKKRVVIVGGGFAGLMAGSTLAGSADVTVFEARDRVGGRVHSLVRRTSKRIIEAGAELIGYAHPTWLTHARRFGLNLTVWTSEGDFDALRLDMPTYIGGKPVSPEESEVIYNEMKVALTDMAKHAQLVTDSDKPWLCEQATRFDQMPLSQWINGLSCSPVQRWRSKFNSLTRMAPHRSIKATSLTSR